MIVKSLMFTVAPLAIRNTLVRGGVADIAAQFQDVSAWSGNVERAIIVDQKRRSLTAVRIGNRAGLNAVHEGKSKLIVFGPGVLLAAPIASRSVHVASQTPSP